jgi:hypothetical protein
MRLVSIVQQLVFFIGRVDFLNCKVQFSLNPSWLLLALGIRALLPSLIELVNCIMKQWLPQLFVYNIVLFAEPD